MTLPLEHRRGTMTSSTRVLRRLASALAACVLLAAAPAFARAQAAAEPSHQIRQQVEAIAAGDSIGARRAAIVARLSALGLAPTTVSFDPPSGAQAARRGANIVAEVPGRTPGRTTETILLSAHYDRVGRGRGVIDNAAGVAAVLELAAAFARQPLGRHTVRIALFDMEEDGLLGSRAMVNDSAKTPLPAIVLNFDIFGYGNALWIGAVDSTGPLPRALGDAGRTAGLEVVVDSMYPPSDHLSFRPTSARSYAITLIDRKDIDLLLAAFRTGNFGAGERPRVMGIVHTDADTLDKLDAAAIARAVRAVEGALRAMDAAPAQQR